MDTQHLSAPSRPSSRVPGRVTAFGVIHVNAIHTSRFTIVGNHLAQHGRLSLTAIGLAVHIQSLPDGAKIGIKVLTDRFPESEARIAAALRELEEHSYLARTVEQLPGGKLVTRTISYNQPHNHPPVSDTVPEPAAAPEPAPEPAPAPEPPSPRPPLPQPQAADLERHREATDLLAGLRRHEPRLLLAERDVHRLTPAVSAWLERDADPDAVCRALTVDLPDHLKHPAGLLAHRLTTLMPPPLPAAPAVNPREPLQNCDKCDRAFRAPAPGHCRDCRSDLARAA